MTEMATAPPPPPLTPPPSFGIHPEKITFSPCPAYAAVPFLPNENFPIQETSLSPGSDAQGAAAPSPPHSSLSQGEKDNLSDCDNKYRPVQETDPAPQALKSLQLPAEAGVQDEAAIQTNKDGEDHLA